MGSSQEPYVITQFEMTKPEEPPPPKDSYHLGKITALLLGILVLLTYNVYIMSNEYWMYKLRTVYPTVGHLGTTKEELSSLQANFPVFIVIATNIPYLVFLMMDTVVSRRILLTTRIVWPLLGTILIFITTMTPIYINTDDHQHAFVIGTLVSLVFLNVFQGFLTGASTGVAGCLPNAYVEIFSSSQAIGSLIMALILVLIIVSECSVQLTAMIYFGFCMAVTAAALVFYVLLTKTEFYRVYFRSQLEKGTKPDTESNTPRKTSIFALFKRVWVLAVGAVLLNGVSACLYPAVLVLVESTNDSSNIIFGRLFQPVFVFVIFTTGDTVSRFIAAKWPLPGEVGYIELAISVARAVLIPLIMLCNAHPRHSMPVVFNHDAYFAVLVAVLSLTNGYLFSMQLTKMPMRVSPEDQETVSSMFAFFVGLGLSIGCVISFGLVNVL